MIPVVVFWTEYTATKKGSILKTVPCENCSTEYLYVLKREGVGAGTSVYGMNAGAASDATSAADETLKSLLENDFDPVPCPVCGHYQRYMFPKLMRTNGLWLPAITLVLLLIGCLEGINALFSSGAYLLDRTEPAMGKMLTAWGILLVVGLIGLGVWRFKQWKIRSFDPNRGDQQERIARGRSRAITRAEFDKAASEGREDTSPTESNSTSRHRS
jgi:hypothetical protein